jgi:selenocysteine lyase/cysteine desulfurase
MPSTHTPADTAAIMRCVDRYQQAIAQVYVQASAGSDAAWQAAQDVYAEAHAALLHTINNLPGTSAGLVELTPASR